MRKRIITATVLVGVSLGLFFLWRAQGPGAPSGTEEAAAPGQARARGWVGSEPQAESPEDVGARGTADAGSTPWLARAPSEGDGVLEVEVLENGSPVRGASARLYWRGPRDPNLNEVSWRLASTGVTDEQGRARLSSRPGGYLLAVHAQGRARLLRDAVRPHGEARTFMRVTLEPSHSLIGRTVEQGTREPLPLVELTLTAHGRKLELWQSAEAPAEEQVYASSNERGDFRVEGLAAGEYLLEARAVGHARTVLQRVRVPATAPLTVELPAAGVIEGFVVDAKGSPAPGAEVQVGGRIHEATTTGSGGGFSIEVEPGSHVVLARRGSEAGSLDQQVVVSPGKTVRGIRIQLGQGAALEGRVVARSTGAPIEGARLDVSPYGRSGDSGRAVSDAEGRFTVEPLAPGSYDLMVAAKGFATLQRRALTVTPGERFSVELQLAGTGAVEGHVRDRDGKPLPGAQVVGSNRWGGPLEGVSAEARTDAEGYFLLGELPSGPLNLTARREGATIGVSQMLEVPEGETAQMDFTLEETGTVEGKVRPASGALPAEPLMVLAIPRGGSLGTTDFRPVDVEATGTFQMTLQPGAYELRVGLTERWPYGDSASEHVEVVAGETARVEVTWNGGGSEKDMLRGVVLEPDGTPSPEASLAAYAEEREFVLARAVADEQGRFSLSVPPEAEVGASRYKVVARAGGRIGEVQGVRSGEQGVVVKLRPGASLRGQVVRADGGGPVKGFRITVQSLDVQNFPFGNGTWEFPGDRFELRDVPAEPLRLVVRTAEGQGTMTQVSPGTGATEEVRISVTGTATVRGRVMASSTQKPVPAALVFILDDRPMDPDNATGSDGRFTLEGVTPGDRVLLVVSGENYERVNVTLVAGEVTDVGDILLGGPR
jgi:hypothetical protein